MDETRFDIGDPVLVTGIIRPTYFKRVNGRAVRRALEFLEFDKPQPGKIVGITTKMTGEFNRLYRYRFQCDCKQNVWCVKFGLMNNEVFVIDEDIIEGDAFETPVRFQYHGKCKGRKKVYDDILG